VLPVLPARFPEVSRTATAAWLRDVVITYRRRQKDALALARGAGKPSAGSPVGTFFVLWATVHDERPALEKMRRAVDALATGSDPLRVRVASAEKPFGELDPDTELPSGAELNLFHRIASTIVSGGDDDDDDDDYEVGSDEEAAAIAESIAALDDEHLLLIARDMLHLYELVSSPPDLTARWPRDWPVS
jgi:hypothetical protein